VHFQCILKTFIFTQRGHCCWFVRYVPSSAKQNNKNCIVRSGHNFVGPASAFENRRLGLPAAVDIDAALLRTGHTYQNDNPDMMAAEHTKGQ
jgi:hypothetical protein